MKLHHSAPLGPCATKMTETGGCCEFPFIYKEKVYMTCTMTDAKKPWCGTETFAKTWGYCKTGKKLLKIHRAAGVTLKPVRNWSKFIGLLGLM